VITAGCEWERGDYCRLVSGREVIAADCQWERGDYCRLSVGER
jgi:hypothetical protein